jgi:hypothetical protein
MSELTDEQFDMADAVDSWLESRQGRDYTASQIARGVHASTLDIYPVLRWMAEHRMIDTNGRSNSLVRYSTRSI